MDLRIECDEATVCATYGQMIYVDIVGANMKELLDEFDVQDVIDHYSLSNILDRLDVDEIKKYLHLVDNPD
jgi:hypothetical protein